MWPWLSLYGPAGKTPQWTSPYPQSRFVDLLVLRVVAAESVTPVASVRGRGVDVGIRPAESLPVSRLRSIARVGLRGGRRLCVERLDAIAAPAGASARRKPARGHRQSTRDGPQGRTDPARQGHRVDRQGCSEPHSVGRVENKWVEPHTDTCSSYDRGWWCGRYRLIGKRHN
jgi:hypothetical protein